MSIFSYRPVPFPNIPKPLEDLTPPDWTVALMYLGAGTFFLHVNHYVAGLAFFLGFGSALRRTYLIPKFSRPAIPTGVI